MVRSSSTGRTDGDTPSSAGILPHASFVPLGIVRLVDSTFRRRKITYAIKNCFKTLETAILWRNNMCRTPVVPGELGSLLTANLFNTYGL